KTGKGGKGKARPQFTPRFFHKELTGMGGGQGRLNRHVHPANPDLSYQPDVTVDHPFNTRDMDDTVRFLPTDPLLASTLRQVLTEGSYVARHRIRHLQALTQAEREAELEEFPLYHQVSVPQVE